MQEGLHAGGDGGGLFYLKEVSCAGKPERFVVGEQRFEERDALGEDVLGFRAQHGEGGLVDGAELVLVDRPAGERWEVVGEQGGDVREGLLGCCGR